MIRYSIYAAFFMLVQPSISLAPTFSACELAIEGLISSTQNYKHVDFEKNNRLASKWMRRAQKNKGHLDDIDRANAAKALEMAQNVLKDGKVAFAVEGDKIVIATNGESLLNGYAKLLFQRYGVRYAYSPLENFTTGFSANYSPDENIIYAPSRSILNLRMSLEYEGHEELHALFEMNRRNGIPSIFDVTYTNHSDADEENSSSLRYQKFLNFEELPFYLYSLYHAAWSYKKNPSKDNYRRMLRTALMTQRLWKRSRSLLRRFKNDLILELDQLTNDGRKIIYAENDDEFLELKLVGSDEAIREHSLARRHYENLSVRLVATSLLHSDIANGLGEDNLAVLNQVLNHQQDAHYFFAVQAEVDGTVGVAYRSPQLRGGPPAKNIRYRIHRDTWSNDPALNDVALRLLDAKADLNRNPYPIAALQNEGRTKIDQLFAYYDRLYKLPEVVSLIKDPNSSSDQIIAAIDEMISITNEYLPRP